MHGVMSKDRPNLLDAEARNQLRDPANYDFRPVHGSDAAKTGAGPYDVETTAPGSAACAAGGARYWIPGRQEWKASSPVPPHECETADASLDLMFLPGLGHQRHALYLGRSPDKMNRIGELDSGCNVQDVAAAPLDGTWWWRVDALDDAGDVLIRGDDWKFTIGVSPTPAPPVSTSTAAPAPGPADCASTEDDLCAGLAGQGKSCESCVEANRNAFMTAECYKNGERHAFIESWCFGK